MVAYTTWKVIEIVFLVQVGILTIFGNLLVILAFFKGRKKIRTYTNYFVVNLAICDLLVGCLSIPFWICLIMGLTDEGDFWFQLIILLDILLGTTSILNLTSISLERVFAVRHVTRHFNLSRRPFFVMISATWILGLFICSLRFAFEPKTYTVIVLVVAFLLPLVLIIASYTLLFTSARRLFTPASQIRDVSRELRIAKTISVIIGLFVICWMPFFAVNLVFIFCTNFHDKATCRTFESEYRWLVSVTKALHYCNSMMNFFVYAVKSPDFREAFKLMLFNKCNTGELRNKLRTISPTYLTKSTSKRNLNISEENPCLLKSSKLELNDKSVSCETEKDTMSITDCR